MSNYPGQSQQTQIIQWTNQNSKQVHITGVKCGKKRASASKSRLIWFEFYSWLVEKVARDFLTNHRAK